MGLVGSLGGGSGHKGPGALLALANVKKFHQATH